MFIACLLGDCGGAILRCAAPLTTLVPAPAPLLSIFHFGAQASTVPNLSIEKSCGDVPTICLFPCIQVFKYSQSVTRRGSYYIENDWCYQF